MYAIRRYYEGEEVDVVEGIVEAAVVGKDRERTLRAGAEGVAVGRGVEHRASADRAAAAGDVPDLDARAEALAERGGEKTRGDIGAAARGVGNDDRDLVPGIV